MMNNLDTNPPLWTPEQSKPSQLKDFITFLRTSAGFSGTTAHDLYDWSIAHPNEFWSYFWDFAGILSTGKGTEILKNPSSFLTATWFPEARLNFAENLLKHKDNQRALIGIQEDGSTKVLTYLELRSEVSRIQSTLLAAGVEAGDRVAAFIPNTPEAVVVMLAAASIGAIYSSASPDFGATGVIERFGQITPKVFVCADGYLFKGTRHDSLQKAAAIIDAIPSITTVLIVGHTKNCVRSLQTREGVSVHMYEKVGSAGRELHFEQLSFNHPLWILFSSGTTGIPKCIIHRAGGALLEHLKELQLHCDLNRNDTIFYQTTCGWMMWNWLVSGLAVGASLVLYDGSPGAEDNTILFRIAAEHGITVFGTNAKFLALLQQQSVQPRKVGDLSKIRLILSTGSPLAPESFDYVYASISPTACLSSISGGTDIVGCFALGCVDLPVYRGELQIRSFGLNVQAWSESGIPVHKVKGELVCTAPFPTVPLGFWNDPESKRFEGAYFRKFPGVWHHGDYIAITEHNGLIFYGRSDTVLNPGGVRIGTAEIYRIVDMLPFVEESIAVGQRWENDERIVLFVKLANNLHLTANHEAIIREELKRGASPFHVPKKIVQVQDIPRTRSGKIVELAVKQIVHGEPITNVESLLNPEALDQFKHIATLNDA
jgi:acetoacetyl-CoA synthetase